MPTWRVAAGRPQRARGAAGVRGQRLRACEAARVLPGLQGHGQEHHALQGGGHRGDHCHRGGAGPKQQHDTGVSSSVHEYFGLLAWVWEPISFFPWMGYSESLNILALSFLCSSALACNLVYSDEIPGGPCAFWAQNPKSWVNCTILLFNTSGCVCFYCSCFLGCFFALNHFAWSLSEKPALRHSPGPVHLP